MNKCQLHLYGAILLRLAARGVRLAEVLARHAPANKREWLLENDGIHPRQLEQIHYAAKLTPREILRSFLLKVNVSGDDDCWEFCGYCNPYGQTYVLRGIVRSHVLMYALFYELPKEYGGKMGNFPSIMHSCDNPKCCNPKHLSMGNVSLNHRDSLRKGRHLGINFYKKMRRMAAADPNIPEEQQA